MTETLKMQDGDRIVSSGSVGAEHGEPEHSEPKCNPEQMAYLQQMTTTKLHTMSVTDRKSGADIPYNYVGRYESGSTVPTDDGFVSALHLSCISVYPY